MAIVAFDIAAFRARYPEFASTADALINECFAEATIYLDNTDASIVVDVIVRAVLFNMLTAHIVSLQARANTAALVGRINQATEGSVTVAAEMGPASNTSAWYMQTQYGASYWQATARYRTFQHVPGRSVTQRGWPR